MKKRWVILCSAAGLAATATSQAEKIDITAAPASVQQAIRAQAGAAQIEDLDREVRDGRTVYEAAFKRAGTHTEIVVGEDGTLISPAPTATAAAVASTAGGSTNITLQAATKVAFTSLPSIVQQTVKAQAGASPVEDVDMGTWAGRQVYQVAFKDAQGQHRELFVSQEGVLLNPQPVPGAVIAVVPTNATTAGAAPLPTQISWAEAPEPVRTALTAFSGGTRVPTINKVTVASTEYYHAQVMENGKPTDMRVDAKGLPVDERYRTTAVAKLVPLSNGKKVQPSEVPSAVANAMRTEAGEARIEDIDVGTWNGQTVYQVGFKNQDKHTEIQLLSDGKVLADQRRDRVNIGVGSAPAATTGSAVIATTSVTTATSPAAAATVGAAGSSKVPFGQLPFAIKRAIRAHAGGNPIEDVDRIVKDGKVFYEVGYKVNDIHTELLIDSNGTVVNR
ncbi:MAG TPA: PepSY-like domain-containing protein [Methylomirabilota bacterium]|nr:PepSY-like domain-containing protein [Methylomirabilota bacterium]